MAIDTVPRDRGDETLFRGRTRVGGFLGPVIKFSEINDQFAVLVGGRAGFIINRALLIGIEGYGLANEIEASTPRRRLLDFGYGGVFLGYVNRSQKLVHLSIHSLIGGGGLHYRRDYYPNWVDAIFVFEPGADLMLNVTRRFRIGLGGSYRFVSGVELDGLSNDEIGGPSASLVFKFGRF
jgi:hypothetical protein